jgi:hypothetical protein
MSLPRLRRRTTPMHEADTMRPHGPRALTRPADNELYDRGCDLVEAAMAIRDLADDPGALRAVPALLGCIEAALHELGCAAASMDQTSGDAMPTGATADRMRHGFMNLGLALADAELASAAARGLAGRSLAVASGDRPPRVRTAGEPAADQADAHESTRAGEMR